MQTSPHTLKAFDDDLDRLRALVCELGGRVEAAIADAVQALVRIDPGRAEAVLANHSRVAALVSRIEREAVQMIALRAPLADDLREVLSAFKIVSLIARMGDCAANVARRALLFGGSRPIAEIRTIATLGEGVTAMIKAALDSYSVRDPVAAARVVDMDDQIDALHAGLFRALVDLMTRNPDTITAATHLLIVSQKLERAADHAAAIAAIVHYAATGDAPPSPPDARVAA
ncbi:MAG: phosphate signaling complex protein PhoU [Sphingomonas sp.]